MKRLNGPQHELDSVNLPGSRLRHWHSVQNLILKKISEESRSNSSKSENNVAALEQDLVQVAALYHAEPIFSEDQINVPGGTVFLAHSSGDVRTVTTAWLVDDDFQICKKAYPTTSKLVALKYLTKQRKIVGCTADMKLKLFSDITQDFKELCQERLVSTALCIERIPETDELIIGGVGFLVNLRVSEDTFQEARPLNLTLRPTDVAVKLMVDSANKQLLVLCQNAVFLLHYVKNTLTHRFENKHETALTCCAFYKPLNFFVTASKDGSLRIWNSTTYRLVRELSAHSKAITDIFPHASEPLLLTCSHDGIVKIWRLDSLELHFKFDTGDPILSMRMLKDGRIYLATSHQIRIYEHKMYHRYYATTNSQTIRLEKMSSSRYPSVILCSAQDGSIFVLNAMTGKCRTSVLAVKMFQESKDVIYIRSEEQLYVLMDNDNVAVLDTSTNPSTGSYIIESGKEPKERIISLALIQRSMAVGHDDVSRQDDLIFAGLQSGEIILLHSSRSKMAGVCRGHRVPVVILRASETHMPVRSNNESVGCCQRLLSVSIDGVLKVWSVKEAESDSEIFTLVNLKTVDLAGPVFTFCMIRATLAYIIKEESASLKIVSLDTISPSQQKLRAWEASHTQPPAKRAPRAVTDLAGCARLCIFCTTCNDGTLWVWDYRGILLRRLQFDETLQGCCFGDKKGTLIIGVKNHLSTISVAEYYPVEKLKQLLLEDIEDDDEEDGNKPDLGISSPLDVSVLRRHTIDRQSFNLETSEPNPQDATSDTEATEDAPAQTTKAGLWKKTLLVQKLKSRLSLKLGRRSSSAKVVSEEIKADSDVGRTENSDSAAKVKKKKHVFSKAEFDSAVKGMQMTKEQLVKEEKRRASLEFIKKMEEQKRKKYWPIAPDGIIPNSVIRGILEQTAALLPESERSKLGEMSFMMAKLKFLNVKTTEGQLHDAHDNATKRNTRKLIPDKAYAGTAQKEISLLSVEYHHVAITPLQWELAAPSKNADVVPIAFADGSFVDTSLVDVNTQGQHQDEKTAQVELQQSKLDLNLYPESIQLPPEANTSVVSVSEPAVLQSPIKAEKEDPEKHTVEELSRASRDGVRSTAIFLPQFKERKYKPRQADYWKRSDTESKFRSVSTRSVPVAFTDGAAQDEKDELALRGDQSAANEDARAPAAETPAVGAQCDEAVDDSTPQIGSDPIKDALSIKNSKMKQQSQRAGGQANSGRRPIRNKSSTSDAKQEASTDAQWHTWRQQQYQRNISSAHCLPASPMTISGGGKAILLKKREPRPPRRAWSRGNEHAATGSSQIADPSTHQGLNESDAAGEAGQVPVLETRATPIYQNESFDESYLFPPIRLAQVGEQTVDFSESDLSNADNAESEDEALQLDPRKSAVKEIYDLSERYVKDYLRLTWSGSPASDSRLLFPAITHSARQTTPINGVALSAASSATAQQAGTEKDVISPGVAGALNVWEEALDTSTLKHMHSDYCDYYKMARKKFQRYLSIYKTQHSMDVIKRMCLSRRDYRRRLFSP